MQREISRPYRTSNVFSAGSGGNVVTPRPYPVPLQEISILRTAEQSDRHRIG
jgi:hypothetical protein